MTKHNKRFKLKSIDFQELKITIYDYLEDKELNLSIYGLIALLNELSYS